MKELCSFYETEIMWMIFDCDVPIDEETLRCAQYEQVRQQRTGMKKTEGQLLYLYKHLNEQVKQAEQEMTSARVQSEQERNREQYMAAILRLSQVLLNFSVIIDFFENERR